MKTVRAPTTHLASVTGVTDCNAVARECAVEKIIQKKGAPKHRKLPCGGASSCGASSPAHEQEMRVKTPPSSNMTTDKASRLLMAPYRPRRFARSMQLLSTDAVYAPASAPGTG